MTTENIPTIIVCIDTTNASSITLRYTFLKARKLGFKVKILSVIESSHRNLLFGSHIIGQEKKQDLKEYLDNLIADVKKETEIEPMISIREGDIAAEILHEVKITPNCVMVVFGKSNSSKSDNTVLPRIAQKIGTKIRVPIMIVPENLDENLCKIMA